MTNDTGSGGSEREAEIGEGAENQRGDGQQRERGQDAEHERQQHEHRHPTGPFLGVDAAAMTGGIADPGERGLQRDAVVFARDQRRDQRTHPPAERLQTPVESHRERLSSARPVEQSSAAYSQGG